MSFLILNILWQISITALVVLGLAIIFGQLRIMNMAHGEFVMIGAYAPIITSQLGLPYIVAPLICIISVGCVALICEYLVIRKLYGRLFESLLATWGVAILLREMMITIFGRGYQDVSVPWNGSVNFIGTDYPIYRLMIMGGIMLFFMLLFIWYRKSHVGVKIKAMVENPILAETYGINRVLLSRFTFTFGCIISGLAGLIVAPTVRVDPFMGLDYLIRAFFVLIVGGLGSLEGLFVGVSIIAGSQTIVSFLLNQTWGYLFILVISILFLWKRPDGIIR